MPLTPLLATGYILNMKLPLPVTLFLVALCCSAGGQVTYTYIPTAGANWGDSAIWNPATVPNANDATVTFPTSFQNNRTILLATGGVDSSFTIRRISHAPATSGNRGYTINNVSGGTGILIFDSFDASPASISRSGVGTNNNLTLNVGVRLDDSFSITVDGGSDVVFNRSISSAGAFASITKSGSRSANFNAANTYLGQTFITGGTISVGASGTLGLGDTSVSNGAFLTLANNLALHDSYGLSVSTGGLVNLNFIGSDTVSSLFLGGTSFGAGVYNALSHPTFFAGTGSISVTPIPEPGGCALIGFALFTAAIRRRWIG